MTQEQIQNTESRVVNVTTPETSKQPSVELSKISKGKVRVVHGANHQYFDNLVGKTVGSVRKSLRNSFNIPSDAQVSVDGNIVTDEHVIERESVVEFIKFSGIKGL